MMILYTGDNEGPVIMDFDQLVDNFHMTEAGVDCDDMRHDVEERGWFQGSHDNGGFLVLNLDDNRIKALVTLTPDAWDAYYVDKPAKATPDNGGAL